MKFLLNILFFTLLSTTLYSQQGAVIYNKHLSSESKDEVTNQYVRKAIIKLSEREYKLEFSEKEASYKLDKKMSTDSNPIVETFADGFADFQGEVYFDLKNKKTIHKIDFSGETFLINKNEIEWTLSRDTLRIDDYLCYKATTNRIIHNSEGEHKLVVTAWYTPDIPLNFGPDGYGGLPGLILRLENNGTVTSLKRIQFSDKKDIKIVIPTKGKKVDEIEFNEVISERFESRKDN
jgi:GLPGLI family protein